MQYAIVPDVSKWNGPCYPVGHPQAGAPDLSQPMQMDAAKFRSAGGVGLIARLGSITTTGNCYQDGRLPEIVAWAEANDIPLGYYFYLRPRFSGEAQAKFAISVLRDLPFHLDFWVDVEEAGTTPEQAAVELEACIDTLLEVIEPERLGIYTSAYLWHEVVKMPPNPLWSAVKLWVARWNTSLPGPWSDGKAVLRDWDEWLYWQYWSKANAQAAVFGFTNGISDLDLNRFNGTVDDFNRYYGLVVPEAWEVRMAALEALVQEHAAMHNLYVQHNETRVNSLQEQADSQANKLIRILNWIANAPKE